MTSKEAIARLKGNILSDPFDRSNDVDLNELRIVGSQMQKEYLEELKAIEKDLELLEILKSKLKDMTFATIPYINNSNIAREKLDFNDEEFKLLKEWLDERID